MKPKKILLIRHGESCGNVDKSIYRHTPDYAIRLSELGVSQAQHVGHNIKDIIGNGNYGVYYSPYFRARQTMDNALSNLIKVNLCFCKEEPRIREQEYSGSLRITMDDAFEKERERFGKFFYRLDGGESGADVFDRVSDFIGSMHRDFIKDNYPENILIFGHGMGNRLFIMKWFHILIEEFEMWKNPRNGEVYSMELQDNNKYKLITDIAKHPKGYGHKY